MRLELLGPLRVVTAHGELGTRDFQGGKPKQLLQMLALEQGHILSKERLAHQLWGDDLPRTHLSTLEAYVSVLRSALDPGGRVRDSVVRTERGGYRLDGDRVTVDLLEFEALVAPPDRSRRVDAVSRAADLRRALGLVRGDLLEDEPYADWAGAARESYRGRRVQALIELGRLSLLTGDPQAALSAAEQAVELNPLAEAAYQVVMTAAYALWRQDEALAAFERCRRALAEELGADPHDQTVALHLQILRHEDVAELLPVGERSAPPLPTAERTPLLDRQAPLERLHGALARAGSGRFTLALVVGDEGSGRSRLLEEFGASVAVPVGSNRCSDLERSFPFLALAMALRSVLPEISGEGLPVLDDVLQEVERSQRFDEIARLRVLEAFAATMPKQPPFVLLLDDATWADTDTVTALGYLQRRRPDIPALVVLATDRAAPAREPLRSLQVDLRLELRPLSRESVLGLGGEVLWEATAGHPGHVADWLEARERGLQEPFTDALRERVVMSCFDLGPEAYRLLTAAGSVEAPTFSAAVLADVLAGDRLLVEEQLDRLVHEAVLISVEDGYAFRAPAVRELLRQTLSPARRRLLAAAATAAATAPSGPWSQLSHTPQRRAGDRGSEESRRRRSTDPDLGASGEPMLLRMPSARAPGRSRA